MSIRVMNHVWSDSPAKGSELLILLAIADFANDEGVAWPGVETLAKKARLSKRQTQYNIRSLVEAGLLKVEENAGPHGTHRYRINLASMWDAKPAPVQNVHRAKSDKGGAICDTEGVQPIAPEPSVEPSKNRQGGKPTPVPPNFDITDALIAWAGKQGFTEREMRSQIPQFIAHHEAEGNRKKNWTAAFQKWMHNARNWGHLKVVAMSERAESPNLDYFGTDGLKRRAEEYRRQQAGGEA